jgi:hypothetical protein
VVRRSRSYCLYQPPRIELESNVRKIDYVIKITCQTHLEPGAKQIQPNNPLTSLEKRKCEGRFTLPAAITSPATQKLAGYSVVLFSRAKNDTYCRQP